MMEKKSGNPEKAVMHAHTVRFPTVWETFLHDFTWLSYVKFLPFSLITIEYPISSLEKPLL